MRSTYDLLGQTEQKQKEWENAEKSGMENRDNTKNTKRMGEQRELRPLNLKTYSEVGFSMTHETSNFHR